MHRGGARPGKNQQNPHGKPALSSAAAKPLVGGSAAAPQVAQPSPARPLDFPQSSPAPLYSTYLQPKPKGAWFDEAAAQHAVDFIQGLKHYQGEWSGQLFWLLPWQLDIVREVFGWKTADGSRLYRKVYIEVPRKAGKTTFAAAIALYLAYADNEPGCQVYFAASDKDQAGYGYNAARIMSEHDPVLGPQSVYYNSKKTIKLVNNPGGEIICLSSETKKLYGLNLHGLIFDELMTQPNRVMWDALTTGQGARRQPLVVAISTAGWDRNSVCFEHHEYTARIAEGAESDPTFLGVVYGAPEGADWTVPETWREANPSLGHTVQESYYETEVKQALSMPTYQNTVRTLLLSQWVGQEVRFIPMEQWDAYGTSVDPESLLGRPCFGGLDLSSTTDLSAFVLVFPSKDGRLDVIPYIFIPGEGLRERGLRDRVSYETWVRQGHVIATPGPTVDYAVIKQTILAASKKYDLKDVNYDRWGATQMVQELTLEQVSMVEIGQGMASMSAPTKEMLRLVMEKRLNHGKHPVLRWNAENAAAKFDEAGNVKLDKAKSTARIDGLMATIMALDGYMRRGPRYLRVSVYDRRLAEDKRLEEESVNGRPTER